MAYGKSLELRKLKENVTYRIVAQGQNHNTGVKTKDGTVVYPITKVKHSKPSQGYIPQRRGMQLSITRNKSMTKGRMIQKQYVKQGTGFDVKTQRTFIQRPRVICSQRGQ